MSYIVCKCGHPKRAHSTVNYGCMECHVCGSFRLDEEHATNKSIAAMEDYDRQRQFVAFGMVDKLLSQIKRPNEKCVEHEKLWDELKLCAEIFIRSSTDNGEDVLETYYFTFEELREFLMIFADGVITQMEKK